MGPARGRRVDGQAQDRFSSLDQRRHVRVDNIGMGIPGMYKAVVFDWDQTVLDSWDVHQSAIEHAARSVGLPVPSYKSIVASFTGRLEEHLAQLFVNTDGLTERYVQFYRENHVVMSNLFPGMAVALGRLVAGGYRLGLLSNKLRRTAKPELEATGLLQRFHATLFRDEGYPMTPDPTGLRRLLEVLGVSPPEALYVGDAPSDIQCARGAGVRSAAALWGTVDAAALLAVGPDYRWHRIEDGLGLLLQEG